MSGMPWIVADFEYDAILWLIVLWDGEGEFEVYRADLPWVWWDRRLDMRPS